MTPDPHTAAEGEKHEEESENLVPQRVYRLHSRRQHMFDEQAGLAGKFPGLPRELSGLPGLRHIAPGESPRYASPLARARHAPMLPDIQSIVRRGLRLYNQGDWGFAADQQPVALNLHLYNRVAPEERGRTWKSV